MLGPDHIVLEVGEYLVCLKSKKLCFACWGIEYVQKWLER